MVCGMGQLKIPVPEERIRDFCQKWKVVELSVFGSALRDDFHPDSDVDVLVSFAKDAEWSLYDWVDMIAELREVFGRDVDLLSTQALRNPFRRHEILRTRARLYAA
jgi:predicted nucleotidyltransferase